MPIYEYICQDCKTEFEVIRPMKQADVPMGCAACGGENIKRKLSLFFAESGGKAVAGTSAPACGSCAGGDCSHCGY
jgi:putative FmdB family regulatory protein